MKYIRKSPEHLYKKQISVAVVGAGGTGSQIITGLARLSLAMTGVGHPGGLSVSLFDPDTVSESNIARQLFYPCDVGEYKSDILVNRINIGFGLKFESYSQLFIASAIKYNVYDIIISCVDTRRSRRIIYEYLKKDKKWSYIIDCGNGNDFGQVLVGYREGKKKVIPYTKHKELVKNGKEDEQHSCSMAEALNNQELFVNQAVSTFALNILWCVFRYGGLPNYGCYINLSTGVVQSIQDI